MTDTKTKQAQIIIHLQGDPLKKVEGFESDWTKNQGEQDVVHQEALSGRTLTTYFSLIGKILLTAV